VSILNETLRIGVLSLQGDFREHIRAIERLGGSARPIRLPKDLADLDGVILPGGESTAIGKLMVAYGLVEPLRERIAAGIATWGTCAGLILLAKETDNALLGQPLLATMDIRVRRESFETELAIPALGERPVHAVFIRAPLIESVGAGVEVLGRLEDAPGDGGANIVAARQGHLLGTAFHPEVTDDLRFHSYFLNMARESRKGGRLEGRLTSV
jgi:5'-phosphate synthase pdxT subunit